MTFFVVLLNYKRHSLVIKIIIRRLAKAGPLLSRPSPHEPKLIPLGKYQILFNELKKTRFWNNLEY